MHYQVVNQYNHCQNEQNVNEEARHMEDDKAQQPKYYKDNKESPKCA